LLNIYLGWFDPWEKVCDYAAEQRQIMTQELGHIHIPQAPQKEDFFILIRVCPLQVSCARKV
jgi:hypothetical protein